MLGRPGVGWADEPAAEVETNLGERRFALKHASKHAIWLTDDHLVLKDTLGCRYEIKPYSALDVRSRAEVEKVL